VASLKHHLTEDSEQADQPTTIKIALRPHQLTLLAAARRLEQLASIQHIDLAKPQLLTRYGVIADRVGAGKSLVALSLVTDPPVQQAQFTLKEGGTARLLGLKHMPPVQEFKPEWCDLSGVDLFKAMKIGSIANSNTKFYSRTSLMLVPHNVAQQWESYIKDQTGLRAYIVKRTKDCDYERAGFYTEIFTADIVVVSCTMLRKFIGAMSFHGISFSNIVWSRLFIDEADSIVCSLRPHEVTARFMWCASWSYCRSCTGLR
jgi:hypothetical protein